MNDVIHFGKYKGCQFSEIPESYLRWMLDEFDCAKSQWRQANLEIHRRLGVLLIPDDWRAPVAPEKPMQERDREFAELVDASTGLVWDVERWQCRLASIPADFPFLEGSGRPRAVDSWLGESDPRSLDGQLDGVLERNKDR